MNATAPEGYALAVPTVSATSVTIPLTQPQAVPATTGTLYAPAIGPAAASGGAGQTRPTVVLAHSAGSGPDSDVLVAVARALAASGSAVLTFAFAYRQAGRRMPDPAPRLLSAWRDALRVAGDGPVLLGGRSLGGRMASMLAAEGTACDGLVLLAYPLRGKDRSAHWPRVRVPALFVSGDRDELCDLDLLERERGRLAAPSALHVVRGADHSFAVRGRARADVLDEVAGVVLGWMAR